MKTLQTICVILIVVGAINWGLVGILQFDLVAFLFGVQTLVYAASLFYEMSMVE